MFKPNLFLKESSGGEGYGVSWINSYQHSMRTSPMKHFPSSQVGEICHLLLTKLFAQRGRGPRNWEKISVPVGKESENLKRIAIMMFLKKRSGLTGIWLIMKRKLSLMISNDAWLIWCSYCKVFVKCLCKCFFWRMFSLSLHESFQIKETYQKYRMWDVP